MIIKIFRHLIDMLKRLVFVVLALITVTSFAIDTSAEEQTCAEIGFKKKTEAFGNCVIELMSRKSGGNTARPANTTISSTSRQLSQTELDGVTCQKYGFKPKSDNYAQCLMQIDFARNEAQQRQAQYAEQKRQYDAQVAAAYKAREQRKNEALMELGLRMMSGQSPINAAASVGTGAPMGPPPVPMSTRTYTLPGNKSMTCTTTGNMTNCF